MISPFFNMPAASMAAIKEHNEKKERAKKALAGLKEMNKALSALQKQRRIDHTHKCNWDALRVTLIILLSRRIRGKTLSYGPQVKCRHCGHVEIKPLRPIHALPAKSLYVHVAKKIEEDLIKKFGLDEFLKGKRFTE